ncbi:DUF402 domain-containing protein [Actinopolymorpha sp. B9G3]|uniref:DUF402 domain-containing protein n=1 Tax=Actinopolymorpha sp. B9G3 TaxID=3158970 RepID=UPI0032D8C5EE
MTLARRFVPGELVLLRTIQDGLPGVEPRHIGYTMPTRMIADDAEAIALYHPPGQHAKRRSGNRSTGPWGPRIMPGDWDGGYEDDAVYHGPGVVRLHVVADGYSIIRTWDHETGQFQGWYVNLELPWQRSAPGFDSKDLVLDVVATDDLSAWKWKDEDEFSWAQEVGLLTPDQAVLAEAQARKAIATLEARAWPFDADWSRWTPSLDWSVPLVPEEFHRL